MTTILWFVDDDGKAYHIFASEENGTLHISQLSDDYLSHAGKWVRLFEHRWHEAPAICKHQGRYWMITSGCTGWAPNAARSAVADSIWGPWKEPGNPCIGVNPHNQLGPELTFGDQPEHLHPAGQWQTWRLHRHVRYLASQGCHHWGLGVAAHHFRTGSLHHHLARRLGSVRVRVGRKCWIISGEWYGGLVNLSQSTHVGVLRFWRCFCARCRPRCGARYLLDGRKPPIFLPIIFLPDLLCQFSIVRRCSKRGARILGGKNMKTLRCRCETAFIDGVGLLTSATDATATVTLPHSWVVLATKSHEVAQQSFNSNFPQMPQIPAYLPDHANSRQRATDPGDGLPA